jgi:hypothetical protein
VTFGPPGKKLSQLNQTELTYTFTSGETENLAKEKVIGVECKEVGPKGEIIERGGATAKASVSGKFRGSCFGPGESEAPEGSGTLELLNPVETKKFNLKFTSLLGIVALELRKIAGETPPEAVGTANFFESKEEPAANCPAGVEKLQFKAIAAGKIE